MATALFHRQGGRRAVLAALLLAISLAPRHTAAAANGASAADAYLSGASPANQYAPALATDRFPTDYAPLEPLLPAPQACTALPPPVLLTDSTAPTVAPIHGGEQIALRVSGLPAGTEVRVLVDVPRTRLTGNLAVPLTSSPPTIAAAVNGAGRLVDARGMEGVLITLPRDTAAGGATISILRADPAALTLAALRSWRVPAAPSLPAISIQSVPNALVTYRHTGVDGADFTCRGRTDARGALYMTRLPAGPAAVEVTQNTVLLAAYHPSAAAGEITALAPAITKPNPPAHLHIVPYCTTETGYVYRILDTISGAATAKSGAGPFGVYVAGVPAIDTFSAQITRDDANGALLPIDHATPMQVSLHVGGVSIPIGPLTIGNDVAGAGTTAAPGYTPVSFQLDTSILRVGKNYLDWEVGSGARSCIDSVLLNAVKNPAGTVLGTVETYFDTASDSYKVSGVVPTKPRLKFSQPIDLSMPAATVANANLPATVFQNWINEGDIGMDVNETIRTDGSWSGTLGGHARLILLNHTLFNEQLPTLSGGGPDLAHGAMTQSVPLAGKTIDVSLYNELFTIPEIGLVVVVNVRFQANGSLSASFGIPGTLDAAVFTLNPTLTFSIVGTASIPTPIGTFSAQISGNLGLAAPITLRVPGSVQVQFGVRASVTATFSQTFAGTASVAILPPQCLGDCGVVPAAVAQQQVALLLSRGIAYLHAARPWAAMAPTEPLPIGRAARLIEVAISPEARPAAPDSQPDTALSPSGTPATIWLQTQAGGTRLLRARVGEGPARTLAVNHADLTAPGIAWLSDTRAVAVWAATTVSAGSSATELELLNQQRIFSAIWDGTAWSAPALVSAAPGLAGEPALAADPRRGEATVLWLHCPEANAIADLLGDCALTAADTYGHGWQPAGTLPGASPTSNAPSVALDQHGTVYAAWLEGPLGMGQAVYARRSARGWSLPVPVSGLPAGARRLALAVDDAGRPVIAEETTTTIVAARRDGAGWRTWNLGQGMQPRLARAAVGRVALLLIRPQGNNAATARPALAMLFGAQWSPFKSLPFDLSGNQSAAMAVAIQMRERSGAIHIVAQGSAAGLDVDAGQSAPGALRQTVVDSRAGLAALDILPGAAATLGVPSITLSEAHPMPGERIIVRIQLRNDGATVVPAGTPVDVAIAAGTTAVRVRLQTAEALGFNQSTTLAVPIAAPRSLIAVRVSVAAGTAGQAILGRPLPPSLARVSNSGNKTVLAWTPAPDRDIVGFAVFQIGANGTPALLGISRGDSWVGPVANGRPAYLVAAIDAQGRLSLPAPASTATGVAPY